MGIFDDLFGDIFDFDGDGVTTLGEELMGFAFLEMLDEEQDDEYNLFGGDDFDD